MRILYITGGFPYPLTSGFLRHYHLIRGLAPRHEIDLVSLVGRGFEPDHVAGIQPFVGRVATVPQAQWSPSTIVKGLHRVRAAVARPGSDSTSRSLAKAVRSLLDERRYDVALLHGRRTDAVLKELAGTPLVVDLCDASALRLSGSLPYSNALRRVATRLELASVLRVERQLMAAGSHVLFASLRDLDAVALPADRSRAVVVPNGVDLDYWHRTESELGAEHVVFSGAMNYRPNEDAALFLLHDVMPRVWAAEPRTKVSVVGREPKPALRRAAADPRVTVTGYVDDMRPHLESGAVFAAPLRFAAGIQNKVLEALAMEMEVVTSPTAAAGVQAGDGMWPPVVIARDGPEFAAAIIAALRNVTADPRPRAETRAYVAEHFSWATAVATLDAVLDATAHDR